jgi:hypothetical protein
MYYYIVVETVLEYPPSQIGGLRNRFARIDRRSLHDMPQSPVKYYNRCPMHLPQCRGYYSCSMALAVRNGYFDYLVGTTKFTSMCRMLNLEDMHVSVQ